MIKKIIALLILTTAAVSFNTAFSQPKIILKLDDVSAYKNFCNSIPVLKYLKEKQIKAAFGVIAMKLDSTASKTLVPYLSNTDSKGNKLVEIWSHGLDHKDPEFNGTTYAYQKSHFDSATMLIKKYLGVAVHSFGSPFNASDNTTNQVISEDPSYKVSMFNSNNFPATAGVVNLTHRVNMETGTGIPDFDFFVTNYKENKNKFKDYMVLQGHPFAWDDGKMNEFAQIIDFLIAEKCEFVLPYELYQTMQKK